MNTDVSESSLRKEEALKGILARYGSLAVAYSGGVDSTYLADVAHEVLGAKACLLLADSPSIPRSEVAEAKAIADERGWTLSIIETHEFENHAFLKNDGKRCYHCKNELFGTMRRCAQERGLAVLAYGETADDINDITRVGKLAANENGVAAPLQDAGMVKDDIRALSARRGLPTWNKASFACLSSRFPVGTPLTVEDMAKIEQAEETLKGLGFRQYRARHHGAICRIEVDPADFGKLLDPVVREQVVRAGKQAGYRFVTLDLSGYKTGSTATPIAGA